MELSNIPTHADTLVIGGGTAGSIIAGRLASRTDQKVVLLEAGPDYGSFSTGNWPADLLDGRIVAETHDWGYKSSSKYGLPNHTLERARVIGGCSSHNGSCAIWGSSVDYDNWAACGNSGWTAEEVLPFFHKANAMLRVRNFKTSEITPFHKAAINSIVKTGIPKTNNLNDLYENSGVDSSPVNIENDNTFNAAFAYLDPVRENGYLTITGNAFVEKVHIEKTKANSIDVIVNEQSINISADKIIVCGGAYESPCILLRSGIGDPADLDKLGIKTKINLPGVGENLHDHSSICLKFEGTDLMSNLMESFIKEGNTIFSEQTIAKAQSKHCREAFDLHIYPVTGINKNINGKWDCAIYTANMAPLSRGNLTLQGENLLGRPRIDQGYLTDPGGKDVAVLMDGLEIIRELSNQEDLANLIGTELSETSGIIDSNTLRQSAWHYFHPVGTCKMGPATDSMAVVDSVGKVHGTDNLYVIDASIMPVVPRGNTNLPIAMLAERIVSTLE